MSDISTLDDSEIVQAEQFAIQTKFVGDIYSSKSKLYAPTESFLNSKYIPPEVVSDEPRHLPGSKNSQFKDVKSKLSQMTQAAINQKYIPAGTVTSPNDSPIQSSVTLTPDERRGIMERLLKPNASAEARKYVKPPPPPQEPKAFYVESIIRVSPLSLPLAPRVSLSSPPTSHNSSFASEGGLISNPTPCSLTPEERKEAQRRLTAPNAASIHGKWTGGKHGEGQSKDSSPSHSKLSPADRKEAQRRLLFTTYAFDASKWTGPKTEHNRNISTVSTNNTIGSVGSIPPRPPSHSTLPQKDTEGAPEVRSDEERIKIRERLSQPTQAFIARTTSGKGVDRLSISPIASSSALSIDSSSNLENSNLDSNFEVVLSPTRSSRLLTAEERREARERLQQPTTAWASRTGDLTNRLAATEVSQQQSLLTPEERREARERILQNTVSTSRRTTPLASARSAKQFFPEPADQIVSSELVNSSDSISQNFPSQGIVMSSDTTLEVNVESTGIVEYSSTDVHEMY